VRWVLFEAGTTPQQAGTNVGLTIILFPLRWPLRFSRHPAPKGGANALGLPINVKYAKEGTGSASTARVPGGVGVAIHAGNFAAAPTGRWFEDTLGKQGDTGPRRPPRAHPAIFFFFLKFFFLKVLEPSNYLRGHALLVQLPREEAAFVCHSCGSLKFEALVFCPKSNWRHISAVFFSRRRFFPGE